MTFTLLKVGKEELELELDEADPTLTELLAEKLNEYDNVEFAASRWDHPLVEKPRLYLKVNKGEAMKTLKKAIEDLKKDIKKIENGL
ncbi:MAG: RpoL/Rpb11 RNA polymerase subunit family protein [Candidatus Anstonellales archaeon]